MDTSDVKNDDRKRIKVDLPLLPDERREFRKYLETTGRKAGPWVRVLIVEALARESKQSLTVGESV